MPWNIPNFDFAEMEAILEEYNALLNQELGPGQGRYVALPDERRNAGQVQHIPSPPQQTAEVKEVLALVKQYKEMMQDNYEYRCKRPEKELLTKLFAALDKV